MRFEPIDLGFSTVDADGVGLTFDKGDVVVRFTDREDADVCVAFREVIGFSWNDELDAPLHPEDAVLRVDDSPWLATQLELAATEDPATYAHYRLCFNACGVLDVLTRRHDVYRG
ncbi:MAG: hypothetical protein R3F62_18080 [Planctomycetota bacterium]